MQKSGAEIYPICDDPFSGEKNGKFETGFKIWDRDFTSKNSEPRDFKRPNSTMVQISKANWNDQKRQRKLAVAHQYTAFPWFTVLIL